MSTENVKASSTLPPSFTDLAGDENGGVDKKDEALASLEKQLQYEKDRRLEERFIWLVLTIILIDVVWFKDSQNATLPIVVLILQLIALMVLARRMQVDDFVQLISNVLSGIGQKGGG